MSDKDCSPGRLAELLFNSLRESQPITPLTQNCELTIERAYEIQSRFVQRRLDEGDEVIGHKIGLTSSGIQEQLGVNQPDFGKLLASSLLEDSVIPTGDLIAPRIEPEIGFLLETRLEPPVNLLDVLKATEAIIPVFEIIDSRIRDWNIQIEDTIADNASAGLYLAGEAIASLDQTDLSLEGLKLYRNGELVEWGVGAAVLGHPARAVAWLANTLTDHGEYLGPEQLVLSGSLTPAVDVEEGDVFTAEFSSLGSLVARAV